MSEHHASVTVNAPLQQVYAFFTHFNDFPKFMSFVKEVTYLDEQRSHWVAQVAGTQEWDAVNENWIPNQQIGWRSTSGLENTGSVRFEAQGADRTLVDVFISYTPPAGVLGKIVDALGVEARFETVLQQDLEHFAQMVEKAPAGALDPMQSHYLFHDESAVTRNATTARQSQTMENDPMMSQQSLQSREQAIQQEAARTQDQWQQQQAATEQQQAREQAAAQQQSEALQAQAERDRVAANTTPDQSQTAQQRDLDPVLDTLGGRNASMDRSPIGDQDGTSRYPHYQEDPMLARSPAQLRGSQEPGVEEIQEESPWNAHIRGTTPVEETPEERARRQENA
ncbi:hypothetical protein KDA_27780 [Dictyobacter alpinus]|uniref:Coenzyme Q-binding protein COQ10 START domain-containing protein n=1 Tax=Dictyobacter alpinus TaxID=2014873 RepID=A0A402B7G2_9CHLR|nr:SRPBCC family protein [Dictyobacter alpinus]GCE27294.1 hypothetical protein KDA_27780 [Dictyobacter alpinus]